MAAGRSGLLHATTGSGKTYAVWFGALRAALAACRSRPGRSAPPLGVLWLTPMRALAADTTRALQLPLPDVGAALDASASAPATPPSAERARQDRRLPTALVTTPESLSLMLTREHAADELAGVHTVIVDEWHELMGNKRGVQVQLALARLQALEPAARGLGPVARRSATWTRRCRCCSAARGGDAWCRAASTRRCVIDTLLPDEPGPLLLGRPPRRADAAAGGRRDRAARPRTLVFTNTRSQAEIWYQLLLRERPDWAGIVALHHGSLDKAVREWVEAGLKAGAAEGGGLHLVARPRRRLPAGRAGAADRQRQGRGAAAAARRPQRPRAGARRAASRWCRRTRSNWSRPPPRAAPRWPGASSNARRPTSRSTCWCSTW